MQSEKTKHLALDFVCCVVDRERGEKVLHVLEGKRSFFNLVSLGKGTANSRILNYLGLGQHDKSVFLSIMPADISRQVTAVLNEKLELKKPGHGIAFTARVHEGCYHEPVRFSQYDESGGEEMEQAERITEATHDLIMVVVNRGYTEEVMDGARAAGATGGTVLHARGCGMAGAEKFFGVTIQPEKEIIMIVASVADSCGIMAAIAEKNGPGTDASAVSFSLPLNGVMGLAEKKPPV